MPQLITGAFSPFWAVAGFAQSIRILVAWPESQPVFFLYNSQHRLTMLVSHLRLCSLGTRSADMSFGMCQYSFELIGRLLHEYREAVWDDPIDPAVFLGHAASECITQGKKGHRHPVLFADQVPSGDALFGG